MWSEWKCTKSAYYRCKLDIKSNTNMVFIIILREFTVRREYMYKTICKFEKEMSLLELSNKSRKMCIR